MTAGNLTVIAAWAALEKAVRASKVTYRSALSDPDLVDKALRIANGVAVQKDCVELVLGRAVAESASRALATEYGTSEFEMAALRDDLSRLLALLVSSPESAARELKSSLAEIEGRVALIPSFNTDGARIVENVYTLSATLRVAANHAIVLLASNPTTLAKLRRCQHKNCRRFFIAARSGPVAGVLRQKYCEETCMMAAHKASATDRKRRSRVKKREAAAKSKRVIK